ncbi:hypothetical protein F2Q68_00006938, partial [Brassica cretica]
MEMTSYSASQLIFTIAPPSPVAIIGPPEVVESSGGDHATMMISNNGLPHQRIDVDQAPEDHNIVDVLNVEPPSPKRRGNEVSLSNMIIASRTGRYDERVIIQMKSEENNLDDGYSWKKYGQKLIMGNQNTRLYNICVNKRLAYGCDVKKHVERRADNAKSLVITYYGNHEHDAPVKRRKCYSLKKRSGSSMFQDASNRTPRLGRPLFSSSAFQVFPPSLEPHLDMTHINMNELSKLPSLPANQM